MTRTKSNHHLTNEHLSKSYTDNFSLALSGIDLAKHLILGGKEVTVTSLLDHIAKSSHVVDHSV